MIIDLGELPKVDGGLIALGIAVVSTIAWLSRLESKGSVNSRDIDKLETRMGALEKKTEDLDNRIFDRLSNIEKILTERLAKIEGKLSQ